MTDEPWSIWAQLAINLLSVAFFISLWANLQFWFASAITPMRNVLFGLVMGAGAVASILLSISLQPGVMFDLRSSLVAIAGLFGGPIAAIVAAAMGVAFRSWIGGPGTLIGISIISAAGCLGSVGHLATRGTISSVHVVLLAVATGALWLSSFWVLPSSFLAPSLVPLVLPVVGLTVVATVIAGLTILQTKRAAEERVLLRAAIAQSPDFHFVKNDRCEFVAVNREVATYNGFDRPEKMIGLTDYDITPEDRAEKLIEAERVILHTGQPLVDAEETLSRNGAEHSFLTTKVPVRSEEGRIIGIAGVTRDITLQRKMEQQLVESRNLLNFAVSEMADGLAMFDKDGFLTFCNERYRSLFPLTAHVRREGVHIREILHEVVRTAEQRNFRGLPVDQWTDQVVSYLSQGGEEQVSLFDGRWLHLRTRATPSGAAMVLAADVTAIKRSEEQAISLAGELKRLASTDSLTGLLNRRSFDSHLEAAYEWSHRDGQDLSLLMIDVDQFKSYNDTYGHVQGDVCLQRIAECLRSILRSQDILARYGGEEFAVILPGTAVSLAIEIADRLRHYVALAGLSHKGSPYGIVTVSIGVATASAEELVHSNVDLLSRADTALYEAKSAGRNQTVCWDSAGRARSEYATDFQDVRAGRSGTL